jgi:hypothetical protein
MVMKLQEEENIVNIAELLYLKTPREKKLDIWIKQIFFHPYCPKRISEKVLN